MARVFVYNENRFDDPGAEYTAEDVRAQLVTHFPELTQATATERTLNDGTVEITFAKRAGTKGGAYGPADLAADLGALPPLHLDAVALLARLERDDLPPADLAELQPDIESAEQELDNYAVIAQGVAKRCVALPPVPSRRLPVGF